MPAPSLYRAAAPGSHPASVRSTLQRRIIAVAISVVAVAVLAAGIQLDGEYTLAGRILPGVTVAGQSLGGLTASQATARLAQAAATAKVKLRLGNSSLALTPNQVGAEYNLAATVDEAMSIGRNHTLLPLQLWTSWRHGTAGYAYRLDQASQQTELAKLTVANQPARDATIVIANGTPAVQPDQPGRGFSQTELESAIAEQLADPSLPAPTVVVKSLPARVSAAAATPAIAVAKQLMATPVSISYNGTTFTPTSGQVGSWITFASTKLDQPPGVTAHISADAIKQYLATIAPHINVAAVARRVNVLNGISTQTAAGQNGVALNADALADQIASAVTAKTPLSTAAPTTSVPYKTIYNNTVALPYAQYIEVNLSSQHLWAYQNHQVVYDSPVTSGATGAGFPTATGLFAIYAKQTDRHLVGIQYGPRYNYDVFVQYWMPFYEGFGLHDASWRNGNFGGQDYYYGGSHGCVNLPLATAAWLYNWSSVGTPVWVHT